MFTKQQIENLVLDLRRFNSTKDLCIQTNAVMSRAAGVIEAQQEEIKSLERKLEALVSVVKVVRDLPAVTNEQLMQLQNDLDTFIKGNS